MSKTLKFEDVGKVIWHKEGQAAAKELITVAEKMELEVQLTDLQDRFIVCSKKMPDVRFEEAMPISVPALKCAVQFAGMMGKYNARMFGQAGLDDEGELAMKRIRALRRRAEAIGCELVYIIKHPVADDGKCTFDNVRRLYYRRVKRIYRVGNALSDKHHERRNQYTFSKYELDELEKYIAHDEDIYVQHGDE